MSKPAKAMHFPRENNKSPAANPRNTLRAAEIGLGSQKEGLNVIFEKKTTHYTTLTHA